MKKIKSGRVLIFLGWGDGINADKKNQRGLILKDQEDVTSGILRFDIVEREFSESLMFVLFL